MLRSVLAVVVGFVATGVAAVSTDVLFAVLVPSAVPENGACPSWALLVILAYCTLYAVLGGYVTALVARRSEVLHALILGGIALGLGTGMMVPALLRGTSDPHTLPAWWAVLDLGLVAPAAVLGGYLRTLQKGGASAPIPQPS